MKFLKIEVDILYFSLISYRLTTNAIGKGSLQSQFNSPNGMIPFIFFFVVPVNTRSSKQH